MIVSHLLNQAQSDSAESRSNAIARLTCLLGPRHTLPYEIYHNGKFVGIGISTLLETRELPLDVLHTAAYITEVKREGSWIVKNRWGKSGVFEGVNVLKAV